jgi:hypothetical protein
VTELRPNWRQDFPPGTTEEEARAAYAETDAKIAEEKKDEEAEQERLALTRPPQAKPFPLDVLPHRLRDYVTKAAASVACPPDFIAAGMLVVLGAALGTRRVVQVKPGWTEAACLWVAVVGRPGEAKSPALDRALLPARTADAEAHQAWLDELATWKRCHAAEGEEECPDRPVRAQYLVSDVTIEKLALVLQENPRGVLLHRDEFGGWIHTMNVYRGGRGADVENFCSIWSGQPIDVLRKTSDDAYVRRPFVAVLGGIQPDRLDELTSGKDDGFIDRLLLVYPHPVVRRWSDVEVDETATLAYVGLHRTLLDLPPAGVPLSNTARKRFIEWHDLFYEWLATRTGPTRGAAAKMPRYCARFALVLAHARRSFDLVDLEDVEGAITLVNYFTVEAARVSGRLSPKVGNLRQNVGAADRTARRFVEWLQAHGGVATQRELLRGKVGGVRKAEDVEEVIALLLEDGRIKVETTPAPVGGAAKASVKVTLLECEACDDP